MIQIPVFALAAVFAVVAALAPALIALGWCCHMWHDAENQPAKPVVIEPWTKRGVPVLPAYRPAARLTRRGNHRCAERLPADNAGATRPWQPMAGWEPKTRSRFIKTAAEMAAEAEALDAKRKARAARQAQAIVSIPAFQTAGAR